MKAIVLLSVALLFLLMILLGTVTRSRESFSAATSMPDTTEPVKAPTTITEKCAAVYNATIDKKVSDITTRENDQIAACTWIGIYPPPATR